MFTRNHFPIRQGLDIVEHGVLPPMRHAGGEGVVVGN